MFVHLTATLAVLPFLLGSLVRAAPAASTELAKRDNAPPPELELRLEERSEKLQKEERPAYHEIHVPPPHPLEPEHHLKERSNVLLRPQKRWGGYGGGGNNCCHPGGSRCCGW